MTALQPPDWIGPVCHACSRLLPQGPAQSREHIGAREELRANDPKWASRTVRIDGQIVVGAVEVAPGWRRGATLVARLAYAGPCRCGKAEAGLLYCVVESERVAIS